MTTSEMKPVALSALVLSVALGLSACGGSKEGAAPPPPAVTVQTLKLQEVPVVNELPGRTVAFMVSELRPQVGGIVKARLFTEGGMVKAGQALYQIDPATFQATLDSALANLTRAEANVEAAKLKADRFAELVKIQAVSTQANEEARVAWQQARADLASARASADKARIDLNYTKVLAPISGQIGRSTVTPGALVTANQSNALATIQQFDPIYVDLTQSSADLLRLRQALDKGKLKPAESVAVSLVMEDGTVYGAKGKVAFSEATVDPGTGSVTLRAVFPNPKAELLPGMYVRARLTQATSQAAALVPQKALSRDPRGHALVMIVGSDNKVEARPVVTAQVQGDQWVVISGIKDGDRVIVEGLQRVRPGATVSAQEVAAKPTNAASPAASAASAK